MLILSGLRFNCLTDIRYLYLDVMYHFVKSGKMQAEIYLFVYVCVVGTG